MMRIITISYSGNVECALAVNDEDEQKVLDQLADENDKFDIGDRCHIHSEPPASVDDAINYIRQM
jgi:hypothetical protein